LLDRVLRLADADDDAVAKFADSYGVVLMCAEHGLPLSHSRTVGQQYEQYECDVEGGQRPFVRIETYRELARRSRAILNLATRLHNSAARLHNREETDPNDWAELGYSEKPISQRLPKSWKPRKADLGERTQQAMDKRTQQEREVLGEFIDTWLDQCAFRLQFEWYEGPKYEGPSLQCVASGLVGAVAVAVMLAVAQCDGLAICTSCKGAYAPSQKPKAGRNNYCPACRGSGRSRDAKRRQRAKKAASSNEQ